MIHNWIILDYLDYSNLRTIDRTIDGNNPDYSPKFDWIIWIILNMLCYCTRE